MNKQQINFTGKKEKQPNIGGNTASEIKRKKKA